MDNSHEGEQSPPVVHQVPTSHAEVGMITPPNGGSAAPSQGPTASEYYIPATNPAAYNTTSYPTGSQQGFVPGGGNVYYSALPNVTYTQQPYANQYQPQQTPYQYQPQYGTSVPQFTAPCFSSYVPPQGTQVSYLPPVMKKTEKKKKGYCC